MDKNNNPLIRTTEWEVARAEPFGVNITLVVADGYIPNKRVNVDLSIKEAKALVKQIKASIKKVSDYEGSW